MIAAEIKAQNIATNFPSIKDEPNGNRQRNRANDTTRVAEEIVQNSPATAAVRRTE
jgi:hypothetical protein